jgi:hypothetical protein
VELLALAFAFITPPEAPGSALRTWAVAARFARARRLQPKQKALRQSPLKAETERRARFSYDGLLGYLIVELTF